MYFCNEKYFETTLLTQPWLERPDSENRGSEGKSASI